MSPSAAGGPVPPQRSRSARRLLALAATLSAAFPVAAAEVVTPTWGLGPFTRPADAQPVIAPDHAAVFDCPMRGKPVHWETLHTFNPAAVVKDGKVYMLYRAEDDSGPMEIGGHTSRLGLAISADGEHFTRAAQPVLFPADDGEKAREWDGGCEDPRLAEREDGTYVVTYTQWSHRQTWLAVASSKDLRTWTKHGPAFAHSGSKYLEVGHKSGAILQRVVDGRLVAARVKGKYWMYWGEGTIYAATSDDLIDWAPVEGADGKLAPLLAPRALHFDSQIAEAGPPPLLTDHGIVMLYNGKNLPKAGADPALPPDIYSAGQALFAADEPTRLLARTEQPFFKPELPWEAAGQYAAGTTFIEGLVLFRGRWLLYYGCADSRVGVASAATAP